MTIEMVTDKFRLYKDGSEYVVTTRKNDEVFRGSREDCNKFMEQHPYGVKARRM